MAQGASVRRNRGQRNGVSINYGVDFPHMEQNDDQ